MVYYDKIISSPVGELKLIANNEGLTAILWGNEDSQGIKVNSTSQKNHPILLQTEQQLAEYFARKRTTFTVPLDFSGTDFQKKVWAVLLSIPFGKTMTYGQIAQKINQPKAARAVGGASNRNPISILIPCHRVIGSSGKLVGFAGGLETKASLLELEKEYIEQQSR